MEKERTFWERPEGTTGMIFGAAVLFGGGYLLYIMLPFIITLLQNTLYAALLAAALCAVVYILVDPRPRTLLFYFYKSAMRNITRVFVEIDPIGIMKGYLGDIKKKKEDMGKRMGELRGEMQKLENTIKTNDRAYKQKMGMAKKASETEKKAAFALNSRKAGRLKESNMTLKDLYTKMKSIYNILKKMQELAAFTYEDLEDQIGVKERERKALLAGYGAYKAAKSIVDGNGDKAEMYNMALEHMADDYGAKIGEMDEFMDASAGFLENLDLQNGVFEADALEAFENWEKKSDNLMLGSLGNVVEMKDFSSKDRAADTDDSGYGEMFQT